MADGKKAARSPEAAALLHSVVQLEKQAALARSPETLFDQTTAALRREITQKLETVLLLNLPYALANDVEIRLWKGVFYKVIEDFRRRSKALSPGTVKNTQSGAEAARNLRMLNGQFRVFLTDTTGFYMKLILKLFAIHGLKAMEAAFFRAFRTEIVPLSTVEKAALPPAGRSAEEKEGAAQAIFRLLIFLGDLARYRTFYLGLQRPEYSVALHFYRMASFFSPDWGNPHNQIAVIATYRNDDFDAVHSYLWSIVVARPFPTSKDNIGILLRRIAKREDEAGSGSFAPRNELVTERDWKEEVVRLIVTVYPDVKSVKSFSLMSGTIRSHLAVPSVSALTAGLASLMAVLHLLETSDKEIETSAATVVGKELILWLDDIARHIEQTANGNPSVGLLDLLDLSSRWIAQRGQISKASVPRHTKQSFIALAEMVAKFKDGAPGEGSCETARDRWSGFTPIGSLAAGSAEENAVKLRDPSVADLIRRIENTRTFLVSTLQPVVPITTSVQTQPRLASASPAPVSSPRTAPAQRPKPSAVEEDDEEEIVLFKGRSSTKPPIAPTARMGSPGMGSRTIGSPIAQIVAAGTGGSPNLAPVTPPPGKDRASPKPAAIGSERRPPSTNKSPVLLPVEGAAPYAAYVQAPAPQMPANADHQLRLESWKTGEPVEEDVEARRREILLRDLMNPLGADSERFDGANRRDSRRAMSPFPNVPGPLGPAPGTPEQAAAPMETDVGPGKGGVGDEDELMSMNMMQFLGLELDTVPKVPRASSLLGMSAGTSGGAPGAPPGLGLGAPAPAPAPANTSMAAPGFGLPIAAPPPDFLDANSAVLLSFFRQQQQETAQRQLADQLRWQQNQLAGLGSVTDFASPFANFGTAHGLPGVGNFGWPDQGHLQAGASNVASAQMAQLSMLGLSPAQIQLLLQTGWQPPINNG